MNILSLDPETVIVEKQKEPMQKLLKDLGFKVIPVDFRHVYTFGGSFHCVTCDVRREGILDVKHFLNSKRFTYHHKCWRANFLRKA